MNNLRKFNWITQYNSAKEGEELVKPSVSLVIDKAVVIYDEDKPTPPKFMATYDDGRTYKLECDGNTTLTSGNTRPSGYDYREMKNAVIGDCVTSIGDWAFYQCSSLTSITIPNSVISINSEAFRNCENLTSIDMPDSVTSIGNGAFQQCSGLTSCTIGSGVTIIGGSAFRDCRSLTSIEMPSGVTNIYSLAFHSCTSLTSITVNVTTPPTLGSGAFGGSTCPIYVPDESVNAYKAATYWSEYASRIKPVSEKPS